jgi:hypothetical protein
MAVGINMAEKKNWFGDVYEAGGKELVAYTEYREHIKTCTLCNSLRIDDQMTCLKGINLHEVWQQKKLFSLRATLKATGDLIEEYH